MISQHRIAQGGVCLTGIMLVSTLSVLYFGSQDAHVDRSRNGIGMAAASPAAMGSKDGSAPLHRPLPGAQAMK